MLTQQMECELVTAHELGHNFGLFHANRFLSRSERPYSDDGEPIDYGNPFAVMGSGTGYMTVPAKVATNVMGGFGYSIGLNSGTDVVQLYSRDDISSAKENDLHVEDSDFNNTFRIYRHDYNSPPLSLNLYDFDVNLPETIFTSGTLANNEIYSVRFSGIGNGARATLTTNGTTDAAILSIFEGGKGYADEPIVEILNNLNEPILQIDPSWIRVPAGTKSTEKAVLRNFSPQAPRGLRGISSIASPLSPLGLDSGANMMWSWIGIPPGGQ